MDTEHALRHCLDEGWGRAEGFSCALGCALGCKIVRVQFILMCTWV
jgi:hypothetical protein